MTPDTTTRHRTPDWETTIPFTGVSDAGYPVALLPFPDRPAIEPPPPARRADCAMWLTPTAGRGFGLECGIDQWRRHADPAAAHADGSMFDALRDSALAAGWRVDANGVWNCPVCKERPAYRSPQPLAHYGSELDVAWRTAGHDPVAEFWAWADARHAQIWAAPRGRHHWEEASS